MYCIKIKCVMDLLSTSYFALFLIIALGFILGSIKLKGISLDVSAVIFIALLFGHYGIVIPSDIQNFGMILFIFTIGIQAGPGFVDSFKSKGRDLAILTIFLIASAGGITYLLSMLTGLNSDISTGLLSGALTSTPGLAAAIESTHSTVSSIGYGIAYPFGVIGVILFVKLMPYLLRVNLKTLEEKLEKEQFNEFPSLHARVFRVENQNVIGKSLQELRIRTMTGANIARILCNNEAVVATRNTVLNEGDIIKAVGTLDALDRVQLLIGPSVNMELSPNKNYVLESLLVTNKKLINTTLGSLNLWGNFDVTVTRIRRSSVEITPTPDIQLKLGDKLMVAGHKDDMVEVAKLLGNDAKALSSTDFFPIAAGIVLGVLCGKISISMGPNFTFTPGLTGGVLMVAIILSSIGKTGPIMWTMTGSANQLLRQLGLLLFLAGVGTSAGQHIVATFEQYGIMLFLVGAAITLIPMVIAALVGHYIFKMNIFYLLGTITGGMTSTPGLAATDSMTKTNIPTLAYATVYPIALVLLIIVIQILSYF